LTIYVLCSNTFFCRPTLSLKPSSANAWARPALTTGRRVAVTRALATSHPLVAAAQKRSQICNAKARAVIRVNSFYAIESSSIPNMTLKTCSLTRVINYTYIYMTHSLF
jgi:hypothetical protein